ncbi:MAG: endonuclease [Bacteroidales bacterium]|nr:endonuclease [Bacteroidales bacterium]
MKKSLSLLSFVMAALVAMANIPEGYYSAINNKKYTDLKAALHGIISEHVTLSYGSLWHYYPSTYNYLDDKNHILDLYSDVERFYSNPADISNMDKEHTVPKSWWGGSLTEPQGSDLYNVIPADGATNKKKLNYSLGYVTDPSKWQSTTTNIGAGYCGVDGVKSKESIFFEPADKYKGDFARIYFYVATCYPDLPWDEYTAYDAVAMTNASPLTLQSWIIPMLLKWAADDPVDAEEIKRNENVSAIQGNRNPFIDYPALAQYIWGNKSNEAFVLAQHTPNETTPDVIYTNAPSFSVKGGTADEPVEVVQGTTLTVKGVMSASNLFVSIDGGEWKEYKYRKNTSSTGATYYTPGSTTITINADTRVQAYCTSDDYAESPVIEYYYKAKDFSKDYLLFEDFTSVASGNNTSTSGSSSKWAGNTNFPTVNKAYCAGNAIKLGTSATTDPGYATSRVIDFGGGALEVEVEVKGWTTVEGDLKVELTGATAQTKKYTATLANDWEAVKMKFENVSPNPVLTIWSTMKRMFVNKVAVKNPNTTLIGDMNQDGVVNVSDVSLLINRILGNVSEAQLPTKIADVNQDNDVNVSDVTTLVNIILTPTTSK